MGRRDPRLGGSRLIGVSVDHGAGHQRNLGYRAFLRGNLALQGTGARPSAWMSLTEKDDATNARVYTARSERRKSHFSILDE